MSQIVLNEDSPAYQVAKQIEEQPKRQFKGVWIPVEIWDHHELSWTEKCLWAEINALGTSKKPCIASNEYLAKKMDSTASSISNMISRFRSLKLIKDMGFNGRIRRIVCINPEVIEVSPTSESTINPQVNKGTSRVTRREEEPPNPLKKGEGDSLSSSPYSFTEVGGADPIESPHSKPNSETEQAEWKLPNSKTADSPEKKKSSAQKRKEVPNQAPWESLPDCLNTPKFKAAWSEYIELRRSKKHEPLQIISILKNWRRLAGWGHEAAITSIENSVANGYQGIFPPKTNGFKNHSAPQADEEYVPGYAV